MYKINPGAFASVSHRWVYEFHLLPPSPPGLASFLSLLNCVSNWTLILRPAMRSFILHSFSEAEFIHRGIGYDTNKELPSQMSLPTNAINRSGVTMCLVNPLSISYPSVDYERFNCNNLYMLLELELPRLLAPDLPSNSSSLGCLNQAHSGAID